MAHAVRSGKNEAPAAASSKFGGFGPEIERQIRKQDLVSNPAIEEMKGAWAGFKEFAMPDGFNEDAIDIASGHQFAIRGAIKNMIYRAKDVENFSISLSGFQDDMNFPYVAGLYLSILIDSCPEDGAIIHTIHLARLIDGLGSHNRKRFSVDGDVNESIGGQMTDGAIIVSGNAGNGVGAGMTGGIITVKGDAGEGVGYTMRGGTIIVEGSAKGDVGDWMEGGEIRIEGRIDIIANSMKHGKIFHKGELIVDK
jgi:hypothetical protein